MPRALQACRFFGVPGVGPNSHFFTILANECAAVMNNPLWIFEGIAFRAEMPNEIGACAPNRVPVVRMYNNGKGGEANHRYLTSHSEIGEMLLEGLDHRRSGVLLVAVSSPDRGALRCVRWTAMVRRRQQINA